MRLTLPAARGFWSLSRRSLRTNSRSASSWWMRRDAPDERRDPSEASRDPRSSIAGRATSVAVTPARRTAGSRRPWADQSVQAFVAIPPLLVFGEAKALARPTRAAPAGRVVRGGLVPVPSPDNFRGFVVSRAAFGGLRARRRQLRRAAARAPGSLRRARAPGSALLPRGLRCPLRRPARGAAPAPPCLGPRPPLRGARAARRSARAAQVSPSGVA